MSGKLMHPPVKSAGASANMRRELSSFAAMAS